MNKYMKITFPKKSMTAKEIMGDNVFNGGKLLYNTDWYKNEYFFNDEKTRQGTWEVDTELSHKGKSWNECKIELKDKTMLNLAEVLYLAKNHEEFREMLENKYTWTSCLDSDGDRVGVGSFGAKGLGVLYWDDDRDDNLGVSSARQFLKSGTLESSESLNLESLNIRLEALEKRLNEAKIDI